jgi:DMSO/TMAO reductase YedYZ molybdopterin-dependent catalytic subunit
MSKERYIAAKQKWAAKQLAKGFKPRSTAATDRLPPGQKLTTGFPVLDLGVQPEIALPEWTLTIDGLVEKPALLSWAQLNTLPQVTDVSDFHCVTTWSKYDCEWSGVAFTTLFELVAPKPEAKFVYRSTTASMTTCWSPPNSAANLLPANTVARRASSYPSSTPGRAPNS